MSRGPAGAGPVDVDGSAVRVLGVGAARWSAAVKRLRTGEGIPAADAAGSGPLAVLARHRHAPVRGRVVAEMGGRGSITHLSMTAGEFLLILRATTRAGQGVRAEPGVHLRVCGPHGLWPALRSALAPVDQFRAPGTGVPAAGRAPMASSDMIDVPERITPPDADRFTELTGPPQALEALAGETARLLVVIEAWPDPHGLPGVWAQRWSLSDAGVLAEVGVRDGTVSLTPRPAGAVAADLAGTLATAVEHVEAGAAGDGVASSRRDRLA